MAIHSRIPMIGFKVCIIKPGLPSSSMSQGQFEAALKLAPHPPNLAAIEASINLVGQRSRRM